MRKLGLREVKSLAQVQSLNMASCSSNPGPCVLLFPAPSLPHFLGSLRLISAARPWSRQRAVFRMPAAQHGDRPGWWGWLSLLPFPVIPRELGRTSFWGTSQAPTLPFLTWVEVLVFLALHHGRLTTFMAPTDHLSASILVSFSFVAPSYCGSGLLTLVDGTVANLVQAVVRKSVLLDPCHCEESNLDPAS